MMKNLIKFISTSLIMSLMIFLLISYFISNKEILLACVFSIFFCCLFITNTVLYLRYNHIIKKCKSKHSRDMFNKFINKWFNFLSLILVIAIVITSLFAICTYIEFINNSEILLIIFEVISLPLLLLEILEIIQFISKYKSMQSFLINVGELTVD